MQTGFHQAGEIFFALCKSVDTPVSLGAWLRFKYSQIDLAQMDVNPRDYNDPDTFRKDYAVVSYFQKWKGLNTGLDLENEALLKFNSSEVRCRETNLRIRSLRDRSSKTWLASVFHSASRKISKLLGPYTTFAVSESYGWGPGATVDIPRRRAMVDTKMSELPITVSRSAAASLLSEIGSDLHWSALIIGVYPEGPYSLNPHTVCAISDCAVIKTVPKNAKTHRIIAVEPRGNAFLQKGFGDYFCQRLRKVGIDLDDQTRNQGLAKRALSLGLCTLDLQGASDSVSKELVYHLLPYDWASAMDALRTRKAVMPDGSIVVLEKFSSMGNGFTFELESLLFWAIAQSVCDIGSRGVASVYGDDIIVPSSDSSMLCIALQWAGFVVNDQKSFFDGLFYESCGFHYFQEVEVTPVYQKELLLDPRSFVRAGNRLMRLAFRLGNDRRLSKVVYPAWSQCRRSFLRNFPELENVAIPFGSQGDDGWTLNYRDFNALPYRYWVDHMGIVCLVLSQKAVSLPANEMALLAWSYRRGVCTESPFNGDVSKDVTSSLLVVGRRRVIPVGKFSAIWD